MPEGEVNCGPKTRKPFAASRGQAPTSWLGCLDAACHPIAFSLVFVGSSYKFVAIDLACATKASGYGLL